MHLSKPIYIRLNTPNSSRISLHIVEHGKPRKFHLGTSDVCSIEKTIVDFMKMKQKNDKIIKVYMNNLQFEITDFDNGFTPEQEGALVFPVSLIAEHTLTRHLGEVDTRSRVAYGLGGKLLLGDVIKMAKCDFDSLGIVGEQFRNETETIKQFWGGMGGWMHKYQQKVIHDLSDDTLVLD